MILPNHVLSLKLDHPADGIADDGASEMPDVHLLGDVRAGVVDDDGLGFGRFWDSQVRDRSPPAEAGSPARWGSI